MQVQVATQHLQRQGLALSSDLGLICSICEFRHLCMGTDLCASGNEPPCLWEMVWYRDNKKTELVLGARGRGASYISVADELNRTGQVSLLPDPQMVHL